MEVNPNGLEKAIAIMTRPMLYQQTGTPNLAAMELIGRVKEIYELGFADGARQLTAEGIIKSAIDNGGN